MQTLDSSVASHVPKPPVDKKALEAVDTCDLRNLLETEEDWAKRMDEEYVVDQKTGDILARRLTPYELALLAGHDWYKEAEKLSDDDYIMRDGTKSLGR